jgi:1,4-dihydroxy-2-naphthoyl-CoA hydrolase
VPQLTFTQSFTASLYDIDAAGVMFFAHYFRHAHDVYEAFMAGIDQGLPELIRQQRLLPLVHSEADFLRPVRHGDQLLVELQLERIGNSSFTVRYRFINAADEEVARLKSTHVLLNPEGGSPMNLPEALRLRLTEYAV